MKCQTSLYSPSATQQIFFCGLEHGLRINTLRSTWPCLIIKVLAAWVKFLKPSGYCVVINCTFTFSTTNVFTCCPGVIAQFKLVNISSQIRICCTFINAAFKSHIDWSNTQDVSAITTTLLPTIMSTLHCLNCFGHMIFVISWLTVDKDDLTAPFSIATTLKCKGGCYSFPLTLDPYLIILSVKKGSIKYQFWVFGMTQAGIEPWSPKPFIKTLPLCQWSDHVIIGVSSTFISKTNSNK